jgi:hypothetical protein
VTLGCDAIPERIAYAREPRKLPVVLSADEVVRLQTDYLRHPQACGIGGGQCDTSFETRDGFEEAADIDSDRMVIRIEGGKGGKERHAVGILRSLASRPSPIPNGF